MPTNERQEEALRKVLGSLGMAKRAGKAVAGTDAACDAVRSGKAVLGIASGFVSDNTRKRLSNCFSYYQIKLIFLDIGQEVLGAAVGKGSTACIAVTSQNLAEPILRNLNERKDG